jgi:hypothetical protein
MRWMTINFSQILGDSLINYKETNGKERRAVLKHVREQLRISAEKSGEQLPEDLKKVMLLLIICLKC